MSEGLRIPFHELIKHNCTYAMVIRGSVYHINLNAHFQYVDMASEFQFLVLQVMKELSAIEPKKLVEIFGITEKIAKNILTRLLDNNLIKKIDEIYYLTKKGPSISSPDNIIDDDTVNLNCEFCITSSSYMGLIHEYNYPDSLNETFQLPQLPELINLPDNLVKITDESLKKKSHSYIYRTDKFWYVKTELNYLKIESINSKVKEFNITFQKFSMRELWLKESLLDYPHLNINLNILDEDTLEIKVQSLEDLKKLTLKYGDRYLLFLQNKNNPMCHAAHKVKLIGKDRQSQLLLLLSQLSTVKEELWYSSTVDDIIKDYWGYVSDTPNIKELMETAYMNKLFKLLQLLRQRGDFIAVS